MILVKRKMIQLSMLETNKIKKMVIAMLLPRITLKNSLITIGMKALTSKRWKQT